MAILTKDEFIGSLEFVTPDRKYRNRGNDIAVSYDENRHRVTFSFRNNISDLIFPSGFGIFAQYKNRIIFSDDKNGFTVSRNAKSTSSRIQATLSAEERHRYKEFVGEYELKFDDLYDYYYIEV